MEEGSDHEEVQTSGSISSIETLVLDVEQCNGMDEADMLFSTLL